MNPIVTLPFVNLIISPLMGCYDTTILLWPLEIGRYVLKLITKRRRLVFRHLSYRTINRF